MSWSPSAHRQIGTCQSVFGRRSNVCVSIYRGNLRVDQIRRHYTCRLIIHHNQSIQIGGDRSTSSSWTLNRAMRYEVRRRYQKPEARGQEHPHGFPRWYLQLWLVMGQVSKEPTSYSSTFTARKCTWLAWFISRYWHFVRTTLSQIFSSRHGHR